MVDINPAPTNLPKQELFYIPQHIDMLWDRLAFARGVSLHTLESEMAQWHGWEANSQHMGLQANALSTEPRHYMG